jgi:anti-sigma regulatory factor (Ser/Thr protein kinase)
MPSNLWPHSPVPETPGSAWEWQVTSPGQLCRLRADLRTRFRDVAPDDEVPDQEACDHLLLAVDELATNGLRHGLGPIVTRIVRTAPGWLIDIADGMTERGPEPANGRDPALGGMGLHLVAELTTRRGWSVVGGRKHVWACLPSGA